LTKVLSRGVNSPFAARALFAQNATAAIVVNQSPGFSQSEDFFGSYSILSNAAPNGGGFFLNQSAAVYGYYDYENDENIDDLLSSSSFSSFSESHFSFANLNDVVDRSIVPLFNTGIAPTNGTYFIAFDVQDQLNSNAVYYGWMNVTVEGVETMDPISFTLNSWAYDNTGASIKVGQTASIPEPSAMALLGLGAMGLIARRRRTA
jgi:hypothetical protein